MLTAAQIRQQFLDFFREKQHTIVPSSPLLPDSPNLLFTNAGMNQFVPIFLGERAPDVDTWSGATKGLPTRAADTQKCIRAGGKHNDLDDVGLDTYHHTFFEMLGNWSFGDYFKKEAIAWSWELIVERFKFPPNRVYATIYQPDPGDPSERDQEAWDLWAEKFRCVGLDPAVHIVNGNKKDNFWMMGETGPCGPCSEIHIDLTPEDRTPELEVRGSKMVNAGVPECIEIWNNVFIQFNAQPVATSLRDVTGAAHSAAATTIEFVPLAAQHVDTGMGFERLTSIIQGTKEFTDFAHAKISNYETDIFRPIFDELEKMSGKKYTSTLPGDASQLSTLNSQLATDVAFRVIGDHIRTLSFAIADGIQPGNTDRNYVLRRILRRAVRYGRSLGFREPFFYKLVAVLARTMGDVFPEIRAQQKQVEEVIRREEESFNKTLDKGIALFEAEVTRLTSARSVLGSARAPRAVFGAPPETSTPTGAAALSVGATYSRRNLPHFERPWAKYMITFTTQDRRILAPAERDLVLQTILHDHGKTYELYAACVMPDHAHVLLEPAIKHRQGPDAPPEFFTLSEIMQTLKSVSAHRINKAADAKGDTVWQKESFDRLIRGDADLEEKFLYIVENPQRESLVTPDSDYAWTWTPEKLAAAQVGTSPRRGAEDSTARPSTDPLLSPPPPRRGACAPQEPPADPTPAISGAFAFRLYDEQGFPLDLTELMARERGLTVDIEGFNDRMAVQRRTAQAAQKKTIIELSEVETKTPTHFLGYDHDHTGADVQEVLSVKGKTVIITNNSVCYAEMGGQVGDTGEMTHGGNSWRITNTQKSGHTWLHFLEDTRPRGSGKTAVPAVGQAGSLSALSGETPDFLDAPAVGEHVTIELDRARRGAIQRHHTVTHLLHWALHEVVSHEATQKGSFVGPDKLTFDFNSAALTPAQVRDLERLVNERIVENAAVSWIEVPYTDVRGRADIMQFFGDKYGETVRVVQIGGNPRAIDGYSMELCAGTHTRATGEIGLFRIASEAAIAAGVRRIEAQAGLNAYDLATSDTARLHALATKLGTPLPELEKRIEGLLAQQKELEKALKAASQREAATRAKDLLASAATINGIPAIIANLGTADGDTLQNVADALKSHGFTGVTVLGGSAHGAVALVASVSPDFTAQVQAGKIIGAIAPLVGGKGGGKPESARGGGKDPTQLDAALAHARALLG